MTKLLKVKMVIIGESGVGKTSILGRLNGDNFVEQFNQTSIAAYLQKDMKVESYQVRLEIWDTAGQEHYRSLTKMFYDNAKMAIVVYDITRKDSFEELKAYWVPVIKSLQGKDISTYAV